MSESVREPYCIHTGLGPQQPAGACVICSKSDFYLRWVAYWAAHQDDIPAWFKRQHPDQFEAALPAGGDVRVAPTPSKETTT